MSLTPTTQSVATPRISLAKKINATYFIHYLASTLGRWIAGCAFGFGICCMCSAFVHNLAEFCFVRALLGVFEGGILPGLAYFVSKFYWRQELTYSPPQWVSSSLQAISTQPYCIRNSQGRLHWLAENLAQPIAHFQIFARWKPEEEKILAVWRLKSEYPAVDEAAQHIRKQTIRQGLLNINARFLFINAPLSPWFRRHAHDPAKISPFKDHHTVCFNADGYSRSFHGYPCGRGDNRWERWLLPRLNTDGCSGYAIFVGSKSLHAPYAACFLVAAGAFPFGAFSPGLVAVNIGPDTTCAVALGILSSIGYLGGIISTWTYVNANTPDYRKGNTLNLAEMFIKNAQRARGARDHRLDGLTPAEEAQLGHLHPKFRYKL
ncbi:hypothetical protein DFH09DRAFT_1088134 [Mycena vulgaris]|nr:hypothetical protein DFH09DRAFT_1088134 [Mycena vulgaris]